MMKERFWEIDFLRGIAIIMMIVFHLLYDLDYFGNYSFNLSSGFWLYFGRITAVIFLLLVGISLTLSFSRVKNKLTQRELILKYVKRGLKIFSLGLIITLLTWIFLGEGFIIFGILHLIGVSIILAYPFIRLKYQNLAIGSALIVFGLYLSKLTFKFKWLLWLGFRPESFYTFDYFPILPWFGLVLIGIFIGNKLYSNYKRQFEFPDFSKVKSIGLFSTLGRNSLIIYLLHQPLILFVLYVLGVL